MSGSVDENASAEIDKPVEIPFPEPGDDDFDEDIEEEERQHYQDKFKDLNDVKNFKPHCSACDRHLGCSTRNDTKMRVHPMLRTLVCSTCHSFYNSGEFDKGEDGSELYCRWCGQGGQVYCCSDCPVVFCAKCIRRNFGNPKIKEIENIDDWKCFKCNPKPLWDLRAVCWALLRYVDQKIKITHKTTDPELKALYLKDCQIDHSECCKEKKKRTSLGRKEKETKKPEVKIESAKKPEAKIETPVKLPPSIQVKKFAAINLDEPKKAQKRPASPKNKLTYVSKPISIAPRMSMNVVNPSFMSFPKRPKMDEESLASTSSNSGTTVDDIKRAREWFSNPGLGGKSIGPRETQWIIDVFKTVYEQKLQEKNLSNQPNEDPTVSTKKNFCKVACVKTVAEHLNLSKYYVSKILTASGTLKRSKPRDPYITKIMPNPYNNKERMPFMPIVHSQYMPRKPPQPQMSSHYTPPMMVGRPMQTYNGYPNITADNINLSLESLTQGLDVNAMLARSNAGRPMMDDGNLVCTPDFPLEPLCEVMEENNDDDVECITPAPVGPPKTTMSSGPKRSNRAVDSDNIIQMTENDVTVNAATGGLKFRVDPQTLSANKMYRLPDGRVFAINANPKMPGGYSATIVALADETTKTLPARGTTYSAKVSAVSKPLTPKPTEKRPAVSVIKKANVLQDKLARLNNSANNNGQNKGRKCDLNVPVEWYIYNVTDAIDSLEYTLMRLKKLKKNSHTTYLRTRSAEEIRTLHKNLDRLLSNSATRFSEIRTSLGKGYRSYCQKKTRSNNASSDFQTDDEDDDDDDDDVEILADNHDEPIFIDENSVDSTSIVDDGQVDLVSSDMNESGDKDKSTKKNNRSDDKETDLNDQGNDSEEPISTSNLDNEVAKNSEIGPLQEKEDNDISDVNTTHNDESSSEPSKQKEPEEAIEINDEMDGKKNESGDEAELNAQNVAVDTSNEGDEKMETSDNVIADKKKDDGNDEDTIDSVNCDSTNAENNDAGNSADAVNSIAGDDKDESEENKKNGDDNEANDTYKDNSLSNKEDNEQNDIDKDINDKDNENDLLNDAQDMDDDDIESLLKGGDELDDLASKVQCIVDMDPDLI